MVEEAVDPPVLEVDVRRLRLDDEAEKELCSTFDCGAEEWQQDVSSFLRSKIWLKGRDPEHTLLAIETESGRVFGFGAWKHLTAELTQRPEPLRVVRICYFGVDSAFKGAVDAEGRKWASRLYATVEADARSHTDSTPDMPFELYCDSRNEPGLRFWTSESRGFKYAGEGYGHLHRFVRLPPVEVASIQ